MCNSLVNDWINKNYYKMRDKCFKLHYRPISCEEKQDIYHEVLIQFLNSKKAVKVILENKAEAYLMTMYKMNCFSKTSRFQYVYNKDYYNSHIDIDILEDEIDFNEYTTTGMGSYQYINTMLEKLDIFFVDKIVFKEYMKKKLETPDYTIKEYAKFLELDYNAILIMINRVKMLLREKK